MNDPSHSNAQEETETINVVPLADLTLVLLIILMVLSPMISQSMIHVSTPAVKSENQQDQKPDDDKKPPEPLIISISQNGYSLNNVAARDLDELMGGLRARLEESREGGSPRPVLVTADNAISVGTVVEVLDLAKQNGAEQVSLLKKPDPSAEPAARKTGAS